MPAVATREDVASSRSWLRRSAGTLRAVVPYLRRMVRKPAVALYWLITARTGLVVLAIVLIAFPTVMPRGVDAALSSIYGPVVEKKLFGLIEREKENPLLAPRRQQVSAVIWVAGVGVVLVLLWLHIPNAVARATEKSRERESEADRALTSNPSHSLLLYRSALGWATDPAHEQRLRSKVDSLNQRLSRLLQGESGTAAEGTTQPESQQTLVLASATVRLDGGPHRTIGPQGRYRIDAEIGRGAMGVVHRACDVVLERDVAIKELPARLACDEELMSRFKQEARALARLTHANIVQIYDFLHESGQAYIVMELVDGVELATYIRDQRDYGLMDALHIGARLADALSYAHARGVVHRDFKPANILMSQAGQPKITDFGLAKVGDAGFETLAGTIIGSPAYMSPEQALGKPLDERTDLYSFGVVLYWMTTGRLPFLGDAREMMSSHVNALPVSPSLIDARIPGGVSDLIVQLLAKEPSHRTSAMTTVATILQAAA